MLQITKHIVLKGVNSGQETSRLILCMQMSIWNPSASRLGDTALMRSSQYKYVLDYMRYRLQQSAKRQGRFMYNNVIEIKAILNKWLFDLNITQSNT